MAEFTYEVTERIAVLSTNARGWERQLNMVSWNGNPPKYDIRDWSPDGSRMAKGISLTEDELKTLKGLLHDLCKANFYKVGTRNVKNDVTGQWEKVPFYQVADQLPYGHGEKSVYLIEHFMRLKTAEAIAIRWHMGGFDDAVRGGSFAVSDAYNTYPLAVKLHIADLTATYLMEQGTSEVENGHPKSK